MGRSEKIVTIAEHYGANNQMRQCVEEMAELTQAICKYKRAKTRRGKKAAMKKIQEELADVYIMSMQLITLCGIEEVDAEVDYKLNRQIKRIAKEKART